MMMAKIVVYEDLFAINKHVMLRRNETVALGLVGKDMVPTFGW